MINPIVKVNINLEGPTMIQDLKKAIDGSNKLQAKIKYPARADMFTKPTMKIESLVNSVSISFPNKVSSNTLGEIIKPIIELGLSFYYRDTQNETICVYTGSSSNANKVVEELTKNRFSILVSNIWYVNLPQPKLPNYEVILPKYFGQDIFDIINTYYKYRLPSLDVYLLELLEDGYLEVEAPTKSKESKQRWEELIELYPGRFSIEGTKIRVRPLPIVGESVE